MNSKPTFEQMVQAYREHSRRTEVLAQGHSMQCLELPPRAVSDRGSMAVIWRSAAAAAAVATLIVVMPSSKKVAMSAHADQKAAIECIDNTISVT